MSLYIISMQTDIANEQEIIWLKPKERYPYLRERVEVVAQWQAFPKRQRPDRLSTNNVMAAGLGGHWMFNELDHHLFMLQLNTGYDAKEAKLLAMLD